jgi:hypothetical protein
MLIARVAVAVGLAVGIGLTLHGMGSPDRGPVQPAAEEFLLLQERFRPPSVVLDDFHIAAAMADLERYFSHWTEESVFLGTDAGERWVGEAFRAFARPHFEQGKGWSYTPRDRRMEAIGEEVVFFDELLENEKLGTCRGSGVLKQVGGEWKIMQYNLSIPIPNEKAAEVVKLIRG